MTASLRAALGPALGRGLTAAAGHPVPRLRATPMRFSIITYNVAFLPLGYRGRDGEACRDAIAAAILASGADVVGLCEAWAHANGIAERVASVYPHRGPEPEVGLVFKPIGAGLALLSRHPPSASGQLAYAASAGDDQYANKGVSHLRIAPGGLPGPIDVFFTHTQAIYPGGVGAAEQANQLAALAAWITARRDPANPAVLCGDLNFDGATAATYAAAMTTLGAPVDAWACQPTAHDAGITFSRSNDFDRDSVGGVTPGPPAEERLDYVLTYPGTRWTLAFDPVEVLRWRTASHSVSDHFGLRATCTDAMHLA